MASISAISLFRAGRSMVPPENPPSVTVLAQLRAVGFEITDAAVLFSDEALYSSELDFEFCRIGQSFGAEPILSPIVR
jgi:hypothetical protein